MKGFDFPYRSYLQLPQPATEGDLIKASIKQILLTPKGSRVMRPYFGSNLYKLLFENESNLLAAEVRQEVIQALQKFEPRIQLTKVEVTIEDKAIFVDLQYYLRGQEEKMSLTLERETSNE